MKVPLLVRRLITLLPALGILASGNGPDRRAGLEPGGAVVRHPLRPRPLVWLTARHNVLGEFCNRLLTTVGGVTTAVLLVSLNATLLYLTLR